MSELVVKIAELSSLLEINDFLTEHFVNSEPTQASHVRTEEKLEPIPPDELKGAIESQTSLMAYAGNKLVGVLIAETAKSHFDASNCDNATSTSKDRDIMNLLSFVEKKADVSKRYQLKNILNIFLLSVHHNHHRQGIASKLFEFCLANGKAKGYEAITVDCTSYFTSRLAEKFGMLCISSVTYDDYNKYIGKILFVPSEPHTSIRTYLKVY